MYRSTGSENGKPRPDFFSKLLSLASFLRAVERFGEPVDILFLNDGEIPEDRLALMRRAGEVGWLPRTELSRRLLYRDQVSGSGMIRSYLGAMAAVERKDWGDDDLVYLVEDDYLHVPEALQLLVSAAEGVPEASYIALYTDERAHASTLPFAADGHHWRAALSTTSTFAARRGALLSDHWIHRLAWFGADSPDTDICYAFQGISRYRWSTLLGGLAGKGAYGEGSVLGRSKRVAVRAGMNLLAAKSRLAPHLLIASVPAAATHMHMPYLAQGVDWEALARETMEWAHERGMSSEAAWLTS